MNLADRIASLSKRQRDCLWLVLRGFEVKEIARQLEIKPETVEYHLSKARDKLDVGRSIMAARLLSEHEPPPPGWTIGGPTTVPPAVPDLHQSAGEGMSSIRVADSNGGPADATVSDWVRPPSQKEGRTGNDLTWRAKLAQAVGLAVALAILLGIFKLMLS